MNRTGLVAIRRRGWLWSGWVHRGQMLYPEQSGNIYTTYTGHYLIASIVYFMNAVPSTVPRRVGRGPTGGRGRERRHRRGTRTGEEGCG